jgi:tol-pal system protein YbgF
MRTTTAALAACGLAGCFFFTSKGDGEALRRDVTTLQDRLNSKEKVLDDQIAALKTATEEATKVLKRNSADLGADVDGLRNDVREGKGSVEQVLAQLDKLQTAIDAYRKTTDARLDQLDQHIAQIESGKPSPNSSDDDMWRLGQQAFTAAHYTDAIDIFKQLVTTYPSSPHAPPAQYFRGMSYTNMKDWDHAIGAYQQLVDRYPQSDLADDGLYFSALAAQQLHNCTEARAYIGVIIQKYPKSNVLSKASQLDTELKRDQKNKAKCSS